ncbi:MAG: 2'-5' RNA ligase family protein [Lapillicoccus sp.]
MVQSVELLLAPEAERDVVGVWEALRQAGLPSQSRQTSPSSRPHATLVAAADLTTENEAAVVEAVRGRLPVEARWGEVTLFGRGPWILVRLVEPGEGMRALQAAVAAACGVPADSPSSPDRWAAHVTLARRVAQPDVERAVDLVSERVQRTSPPGMPMVASAVRRWDGTRRVEWVVGSAADGADGAAQT